MAVALQIRDVPEELRDVLAAQAAASGQSLQAFLLDLLQREARLLGNLALVSRPLPSGGLREDIDVAAMIRELRAERDEHVLRVSRPTP